MERLTPSTPYSSQIDLQVPCCEANCSKGKKCTGPRDATEEENVIQLALATPTQRARAYRIETSSIASFLVIAAVVMASLAVVLALDVGEPVQDTTGAQPWLRWPATIIVGGLATVLLGASLRYLCVRLRPVPTLVNTPLHAVVTRPPAARQRAGVEVFHIDVALDNDSGRSVASIADAVSPSSICEFSVGSRWQVYPLADDARWVALSESHHEIIRYGYLIHTGTSKSRSHLLVERPGPGSDLAHRDATDVR